MKQGLTIAGSDSGGGAGIQADLKTFHAHGVFGTSVITAVTAQNTVAVIDTIDLPTGIIRAQLDAIFDDFDIAAAKTGMLSSADIVATVTDVLAHRKPTRLVVDPVMISTSGCRLLEDGAIEQVKERLLPLALIVTPNIYEAQCLAGMSIESIEDVKQAARRIFEYGPRHVLIKGGHAAFAPATDVLYDGDAYQLFESRFIDTPNLHGSGCTFSAAITARLALGEPLPEAVANAKIYITRAIERSLDIGRGHGPTNHFYFAGADDSLK